MREVLQNQLSKVEGMKADISKPGWKKVAGELLSSDLEEKVDG